MIICAFNCALFINNGGEFVSILDISILIVLLDGSQQAIQDFHSNARLSTIIYNLVSSA